MSPLTQVLPSEPQPQPRSSASGQDRLGAARFHLPSPWLDRYNIDQSWARDHSRVSRQRQRDNVIEHQGQEKIRQS